MLYGVLFTRAELRRAYRLNLGLASGFAAGCGFAWRITRMPDVAHPWLWWAGGLACQILALIFMRETLRYWREFSNTHAEDAPSGRIGATRSVSLYRGFYMLFDLWKDTLTRLGSLVGGVLAIGIGGGFMWLGWHWRALLWDARWPQISEWFGWTGIFFFATGVWGVVAGLGALAETFRFALRPDMTPVHGTARLAEPWEAQAAARGKGGTSPLHDQQFSD
jgi:hypothetical protein